MTEVSKSGQVRRINWEEYSRLCTMLARKIENERAPDVVVGIAHGGVIVGATVATILGRDFFPIKFSRRVNARVVRKRSKLLVPPTAHLEGASVLLVDDASNSGETLKAAARAIKKHHPKEVTTAVLVRSGAFEPDYMATYFAGHTFFPWMLEDEKKSQPGKPGRNAKKKRTGKSGTRK